MAIQTALDSISNNAGSPFGFKNRIINGGMVIDQRNAGNSGTVNSYTVDRWAYYGAQASKGTWQQTPSASESGYLTRVAAGHRNYLSFTSSSAYSVGTNESFSFYQWIEGYSMADFAWGTTNAQSVTLSFWVRSSITGTHSLVLTNNVDRTYPAAYTISSSNTWEYKTITIPGCVDGTWNYTNGAGVALCFNLGTGTAGSATSGSWNTNASCRAATGSVSIVGTNAATLYFTGVQLEKGNQATSFDFRPITTEYLLCQRYFCASNKLLFSCGPYGGAGAQQLFAYFTYPAKMRSAPTVTAYSGDYAASPTSPGSSGVAYNDSNGTTVSCTLVDGGTQGVTLMVAGSGFATGVNYRASLKAEIELG